MLKICHIISGDLWAGAEIMACTLLNNLKKFPDLDIPVILLNEGRLAEELRNSGFSVIILNENQNSFFQLVRKARKLFINLKYDIIHSHRYKENLLVFIATKGLPKVSLLATHHGLPEVFEGYSNLKQQLKEKLNFFILSRYFTNTVAVSFDIKNRLVAQSGFNGESIEVIHNGIKIPERYLINKEPSPDFTIGSSGRLFPIKDYPLMVETARLVTKQMKQVRFQLAGEGPSQTEIESLILRYGLKEQFELKGHLNEMGGFYRGLNLYINTSVHEGIPMSILEAMTMGIPIVAPDVGGIKEIIDDGVEGFLVKGRDPQDFAEKCLEIITNDKLRDSMSNAAQDKVIQFFSAEKMAMNYYKLYKLLGDD